jgi:CheY-like chemotaxis protein/two-component sensor histidine kinase
VLSSVFEEAVQRLNLSEVHFNYSGDGYVVSFPGNSSARVLDFINAAIPQLIQKLNQYNQQFRAGLDFGLVHMSKNSLTGSTEHFDLPGIQASRFEACAQENQILCSETVFHLFRHHYPNMFLGEAILATTKDRQLAAYAVQPIDFSDVRKYFEDFIFRKAPDFTLPVGERTRVLFVDDDHYSYLPDLYDESLSEFTLEAVSDGSEALERFQPGVYALVVTDEMMPRVRGIELTERLVELDGDLPIVMLTCYHSEDLAKRFFAVGGTYFLDKIGNLDEIRQAFRRSIVTNVSGLIRKKLDIVADDIGEFLFLLQEVSEEFNSILTHTRSSNDLAYSLLRHKAKQVILTYLDTVFPGNDMPGALRQVRVQLHCVHRLLRAIGSVYMSTLEKHLKEYAADQIKLNPQVQIFLVFDAEKSLDPFPLADVLTLIVCELIDNSLASVNGSGQIKATFSLLPSAQLLQISVWDSGPGVPVDLHHSMFNAGVSTKGTGRGLGLCLVREAVSALKGEIRYQYDNGALFSIIIPATGRHRN